MTVHDDLKKLRAAQANGITELPEWTVLSEVVAKMMGEADTEVLRSLAAPFALAMADLAAVAASRGAARERAKIVAWLRKNSAGTGLSGAIAPIERGEHDT